MQTGLTDYIGFSKRESCAILTITVHCCLIRCFARLWRKPDLGCHQQLQAQRVTIQIGDRFKTLSLTLEMPFKDTAEHPDPVQGWSPGRTKSFGASILNPIVDTVPSLDG